MYTAFSLILSTLAQRPLIGSETELAPWYSCPQQLLISKVRLPISVRIVSAKAFPDKPNSQCRKAENSSHLTVFANKSKDDCSWFEQSDASSAKIEKNLLSFMSLIGASFMNLP